jgi:hypothetical protein
MKQNNQIPKRWWNYQLVRLHDDEHECCVLYEMHWKQEKNQDPCIWMYRSVDVVAANPDEMLAMLNNIIRDVQSSEVLSEDMLPNDDYSALEYQRVLAEIETHGKD